jgi:hypothetical protein
LFVCFYIFFTKLHINFILFCYVRLLNPNFQHCVVLQRYKNFTLLLIKRQLHKNEENVFCDIYTNYHVSKYLTVQTKRFWENISILLSVSIFKLVFFKSVWVTDLLIFLCIDSLNMFITEKNRLYSRGVAQYSRIIP